MGKTEKNNIEEYFEWYLNELIDAGYVHSWTRESDTFELYPPFIMNRKKYHKTKEPTMESYALLGKTVYTYDYKVRWNEKSVYILYNPVDFSNLGDIQILAYPKTFFLAHFEEKENFWCSYVDVKPPNKASRFSGSLTSFATFPLKQQALLWLHGVYVNKVVPIPMSGSGHTIALFPNTFTPRRYLMTDGAKQDRKIRFPIKTMSKYISGREAYIAQLSNNLKRIRDKKIEQGELFGGNINN